jgi:hypothetical protein
MLSHFAQISQERVEIHGEQKATGNSEIALLLGLALAESATLPEPNVAAI